MKTQIKYLTLVLAGATLATLAGCGGGGDSNPAPATPALTPITVAPTPALTPITVAPTPALTLTGTAATGAAISGGPVAVKCASGTGSAITNADGSYTVSVSNGAFPCLAKVTAADGTVLNSVVTGSGSSAVANITPVTQLIVASLAGGDPSAYFAAFDATAASGVTSARVAAAQTAVVATLKAAGQDLSGLGDLLTGSLVPATGGSAGNAYDKALDALKTAVAASGITLADLANTVIATSPNTPPTTAGGPAIDPASIASLPAELALSAQAATCSALRSTTYRFVSPTPGAPLASQFGSFSFNAATLTRTNLGGSTATWVPVANRPCRFTGPNGTDLAVSQAGVIIMRGTNDGGVTLRPVIAFPLQSHTVAEMTGTWNMLGLQAHEINVGQYIPKITNAAISVTGTLSAATVCSNNAATPTWSVSGADCQSVTPSVKFAGNTDGGIDMQDVTNAVVARLFAYKAGGGELMAIFVGGDGEFNFLTRARTLSLPANVGVLTSTYSTRVLGALTVNAGVVPATSTVQNKVVSLTDTSSFVRTEKVFGTSIEHSETLTANMTNGTPRNGFNFRAKGTTPATDGSTAPISEITILVMRGMGFNAVVVPEFKFLSLSVGINLP